ncbi:protein kinase [Streptomyces niger]|uniref:protein kinase n=1 Tax=Streptomyces niger TaxID=66373 RepID=UPI00069CB421|nr:protein kinase [Streptomyces niger]
MDEYAGRVLAERYRLPVPPPDAPEPSLIRALDTRSGQEVLIRQVPLPEVVDAELVDDHGPHDAYGYDTDGGTGRGYGGAGGSRGRRTGAGAGHGGTGAGSRADRDPADPVVRRALEAATAAARLPDHPRLDQVFDVFAQDGSLWIVSERVPARPLSALLAEETLTPHRAAEIAADVLTALRALHAHGWTHRNITPRTVLVCDDGRVVLTGLAAGAAEEALCGYDPTPRASAPPPGATHPGAVREWRAGGTRTTDRSGPGAGAGGGRGADDGRGTGAGGDREAGAGDGRTAGAGGGWDAGVGRTAGAGDGRNAGAGSGRDAGDGRTAGMGGGRDAGDGRTADAGSGRNAGAGASGSSGVVGAAGSGQAPRAAGPRVSAAEGAGRGGVTRAVPEAGRQPGRGAEDDPRRARAGAIAAYRAGATAARTAHDTHAAQGLPDQGNRSANPAGPPDQPSPPSAFAAPQSGAVPPGPPGVPQHRPGPPGQSAAPQGRPAGATPGTPQLPPGPPGVPQRGQAGGAQRQGNGVPPAARQPARPGSATYGGGLPGPVRRPQSGTQALPTSPTGPGAGPVGPPASGPGTGAAPLGPPGPRPPAGGPPASGGVPGPRAGAPTGTRPGAEIGAYSGMVTGSATGSVAGAGSGSVLAAERARQARITMVGAVTERWAPEQAGPVHANWRLAPPVGPATDLWALGALLFRSVQGHAPYPEDSAAELVQLVCARPPAQAEECGALRPVVESLLRQDPTDRPDFEELRGWLSSLVRTAPEPDAGQAVVTVPALGPNGDPRRLPIVRRRGELVRRGRHKKPRPGRGERPHKPAPPRAARPAARPTPAPPARPAPPPPPHHYDGFREHEGSREHGGLREREEFREHEGFRGQGSAFLDQESGFRDHDGPRGRRREPQPGRDRAPRGGPRRLGMLLLGLVLLLVVGAVLIAVLFLPESGSDTGASGGVRSAGPSGAATGAHAPDPARSRPGSTGPGSSHSQTTAPAGLADGFEMRDDPEGFRIAVRKGWQRHAKNARGQVRYTKGGFTLIVVPGRDTAKRYGSDPMAYQQDKEAELASFRDASWTSTSGVRRTDVGRTSMAEGTFTWGEDSDAATYARNMALLDKGRYHLVLAIGPDRDRAEVDRFYEQASTSFRP